MSVLGDIRQGIANNLAEIGEGWDVSPYMKAFPHAPCIHVIPAGIEFDETQHRGLDRYHMKVQAFVGTVDDKSAQQMLDELMAPTSTKSVKALIEADPQLGGACDDLIVDHVGEYRTYIFEGRPSLLGAEWSITLLVEGS